MARLHTLGVFAGFLLASGLLASQGVRAASLEDRIHALEPVIGHYPANIKDVRQARDVKVQYEALKRELDAAISARPNDEKLLEKLLVERGVLQSMGHNFDYPDAWDGATKDLTAALKKNPNNVPAILALADLWVNSRPDLARDAEALFRAAQCYTGDTPLEEAQRGMFFALYYQGKIKEAASQAQYLKQTWPDNQTYPSFVEIGRTALEKKSESLTDAPAPQVMASCADGKPH
jgi:tetratricopeptide (TPR) repeat protein